MGNSEEKKSTRKPMVSSGSEKLISGLKDRISKLEDKLEAMKKEEKRLRETEENFIDIFETVTEGLVYTTLAGKVISLNKNLERILDIKKADLVGKSVITLAEDLLTKDSLKNVLPVLRSLISGREVEPFKVEYRDKILEVSAKINLRTRRLTGTVRDITGSRKTEDALRISETRLRRAELASRSGNWELHLDSGTMIGSEGAMKLYGVKDFAAAYSMVREVPLSEYRELMDQALNDLIKYNKPYDIEFKIRNRETGEIIDIHSICEFDRENRILFGVIQDITARKRAEAEIIARSRNLSKLLELTMDLLENSEKERVLQKIVEKGPGLMDMDTGAIYTVKGDNLYLKVASPPLPEGLPEEFRKAKLNDHPHILKATITKKYLILPDTAKEQLSPEEKMIAETRGLRTIIYVPLIANTEVVAALIFGSVGKAMEITNEFKDMCITLSNIASLALENSMLFSNLTIAKEKAEESDRLKTAFLRNISHEIRTPLNAIIGFAGFLDQPDLTHEERRNYYDIIVQSNNQLLSIINDIINISHIESGQVEIKEKRTNLNHVIKNLYYQFLGEAEKKKLSFCMPEETGRADEFILTDENKLVQILTNLLNNAFKFTERGFITFGYREKGRFLEFFVEDSGIGIPESEHLKIFQRFYQIDKSLTKLYGGTGLGLSISDAYVRLLGGEFTVRSAPGQGSLFSFTIPLKPAPENNGDLQVSQPAREQKHDNNKTIVVAEDEYSNFALINAILQPFHYNIIHVTNGQEVVDLCNSGTNIDLVLMDIKMPQKDGFRATSEILLKNPGIPVIAQTAYAHPDDIIIAKECGCVDYLTKPFDREHLITLVKKYLE